MSGGSHDRDGSSLSTDDAFAVIGHETRIRIVEALATADRAERPLAFSELRDRVGTIDSSQFNYHLGELVGHFVERTDDGYDLRRAGGRVAEAIFSGTVTDDPVVERTRITQSCPYCGAAVELAYRQERIETYCTECAGRYGTSNTQEEGDAVPDDYGFLGNLHLPPAGIQNRTPTEIHEAGYVWSLSERLVAASGTCPRCSTPLEESVDVCEDHHAGEGDCTHCGNRYAVLHTASCTNCVFAQRGAFALWLLDETDLQAFLTSHGVNLVSPKYERYSSIVMDYEENVAKTSPFEATFTFTAGDDAISLTVDETFDVAAVSRHPASDDQAAKQ